MSQLRLSKLIRATFRSHGLNGSNIWTNRYENHRTIKTYLPSRPREADQVTKAIRIIADHFGLTVRIKHNEHYGYVKREWMRDSIIVSIPNHMWD